MWFIIIYYTLLCIVAKYAYFLFWDGKATDSLQPTGINYIYGWQVNFSLTNYCVSNTTPFFLIFILAEMQIMVYRSNIYLQYSFSLMSSASKGKSKNNFKKKAKIFVSNLVILVM